LGTRWEFLKIAEQGTGEVTWSSLTPLRFGWTQTEETVKTLCRSHPALEQEHSPGREQSAVRRPSHSAFSKYLMLFCNVPASSGSTN
jgi:hypothetical protein